MPWKGDIVYAYNPFSLPLLSILRILQTFGIKSIRYYSLVCLVSLKQVHCTGVYQANGRTNSWIK